MIHSIGHIGLYRSCILLALLLLAIDLSYGQEIQKHDFVADSLKIEIEQSKSPDNILTLVELFKHVFPTNHNLTDSILAILENTETAYPRHYDIPSIWLIRAQKYNYENKYDSLKLISQKVLSHPNTSEYQTGRALNNLGIFEERSGSLDSALVYYKKSMDISDFEKYKLYNNLGRIYSRMSDIGQSITYYELAMNTARNEGHKNAEAVISNNIGTAYEQIDNLIKAKEYYIHSLRLKEELGDDRGKLYALYNLTLISNETKDSIDYVRIGLALATKLNNNTFIDAFNIQLGRNFIEAKDYNNAENLLIPLYKKIKESNSEYNMAIEMVLARLYIAKGEFNTAKKYLDDFKNYATRINASAEIHNIGPQYLQIYEGQKDYKNYYELASKYYSHEDSIKSEIAINKFIRLEEQLDEEQKEKVNLLNDIINQKEKSRLRLGVIGLLTAALLLLLLFMRNRRVKDQNKIIATEKKNTQISHELNQKLTEIDEHKNKFFTNITHELRTPLTLILGPLRQLKSSVTDPKQKSLIVLAEKNAQRQLLLVNQLLDISKIDAGKTKIQMSLIDLLPFVKDIAQSFNNLAASKEISINIPPQVEEVSIYFDSDMMRKILYNLLSNAIKYTDTNGKINIIVSGSEKSALIVIQDNGRGIASAKLEYVFDRFYQINNTNDDRVQSTGIGLSLTKELVVLQNGKIDIESTEGKGTTVRLEFPTGRDHLKDEDIIVPTKYPSHNTLEEFTFLGEKTNDDRSNLNVEINSDTKSSILIIEDNDEVRNFLSQIISPLYHVTTAADGAEGKEIALQNMPDLIISDVMMPILGGFELCHYLKQDINTSHIPIILLTAKATHDEKMEGLETGADAYVFKPFDPKEILLRVKNLLSSRQLLKSKFATSVTVTPSEITTNSIDEEFLSNALLIVEENMANEAFKVDDFAQQMNMSKPNLNRKLRALVDNSTNKFIQSIRLQRAKDLLLQKSGTVTEVSYMVGFSSPSYFVKCYKNMFKETPGSV